MEFINTQFNISHSTINNIMFEVGPRKDKKSLKLSKITSKILYSKVLQELIQEYVWNTTGPFWLDDVSRYVKVKRGLEIQKHQLRIFLRDTVRFSYKKGKKRCAHLSIDFKNSLKRLFGVRFIHNLKKGWVLINIDESVIKQKYSNQLFLTC